MAGGTEATSQAQPCELDERVRDPADLWRSNLGARRDPITFARRCTGRRKRRADTERIAAVLERNGVRTKAGLDDDGELDLILGALTNMPNWRAIKALPEAAVRDAAAIRNALEYHCRDLYVRAFTSAPLDPIPAGGDLRAAVAEITRGISKWAHAMTRRGIDPLFRAIEFARRPGNAPTAWRWQVDERDEDRNPRLHGYELRRGDYRWTTADGRACRSLHDLRPKKYRANRLYWTLPPLAVRNPDYDPDVVYYHVHAHVLYASGFLDDTPQTRRWLGIPKARPGRIEHGELFGKFLSWSAARLGGPHAFQENGRVASVGAACAYALKGSDILDAIAEGEEEGDDGEVMWLVEQTHRGRYRTALGSFKAFLGAMRTNVEVRESVNPATGEVVRTTRRRPQKVVCEEQPGGRSQLVIQHKRDRRVVEQAERDAKERAKRERRPAEPGAAASPGSAENLIVCLINPTATLAPYATPKVRIKGFTADPKTPEGRQRLEEILGLMANARREWLERGLPTPGRMAMETQHEADRARREAAALFKAASAEKRDLARAARKLVEAKRMAAAAKELEATAARLHQYGVLPSRVIVPTSFDGDPLPVPLVAEAAAPVTSPDAGEDLIEALDGELVPVSGARPPVPWTAERPRAAGPERAPVRLPAPSEAEIDDLFDEIEAMVVARMAA